MLSYFMKESRVNVLNKYIKLKGRCYIAKAENLLLEVELFILITKRL